MSFYGPRRSFLEWQHGIAWSVVGGGVVSCGVDGIMVVAWHGGGMARPCEIIFPFSEERERNPAFFTPESLMKVGFFH